MIKALLVAVMSVTIWIVRGKAVAGCPLGGSQAAPTKLIDGKEVVPATDELSGLVRLIESARMVELPALLHRKDGVGVPWFGEPNLSCLNVYGNGGEPLVGASLATSHLAAA